MAKTAQVAFIAGVILVAALVDVVVLAPLNLPGAPPDVVLLVVAALALVLGPVGGSFVGFFAGLAVDLLPPADHLIGRYALVFCLIGYLVGLLQEEARDSVLLALITVAIAAGVATLLYGVVGGVLGDDRVGARGLVADVPYSIAYDVLLAPFVVPWVMSLTRRLQSQVVRA